MIAIFVGILATTLFFAAVGYYLFRQIANGRGLPVVTQVGLLIALLAGLFLLVRNTSSLAEGYRRIKWPTASGTITEAIVMDEYSSWHIDGPTLVKEPLPDSPELHDYSERRERLNLRPRISYVWRVDGESYQGTTNLGVPGFGGKMNRRDMALKLLGQYLPGSEVAVYYNPAAPSEGHLRPGPRWEEFGQLSLGALLLGVGLGGLLVRRSAPTVSADAES